MPTGQNYSSVAVLATLTAGISNSSTTCTVNTTSGFPATPFTIALDPGQANQELCDVTNVTGLTLTITRAVDGSSAQAHSNNAQVMHAGIGRDFREARAHIDASTSNDSQGHSVHGLQNGSSVVGTTDTQTLTNKTLTSPVLQKITVTDTATGDVPLIVNAVAAQTGDLQDWKVNGTTLASIDATGKGSFKGGLVALGTGTDVLQEVVRRGTDTTPTSDITQWQNAAGASVLAKVQSDGSFFSAATIGNAGITGAVNNGRWVGSTSGGPPTTGTFNIGDWVVDQLWGINWTCINSGSPGTWRPSGPAILGEVSPTAGSNIAFNSIPQYFKHLRIIGSAAANNATTLQDLDIQFNGDTGGNYGSFGGFVSNASTGGNGYNGINQNQGKCGILWGNANPELATFEIVIPNYSSSSIWKNFQFLSSATQWNITTSYNVVYGGGAWHNNTTPTQAITSILLFPAGGSGFLATSTATLVGYV